MYYYQVSVNQAITWALSAFLILAYLIRGHK